jgi:predicted nucleic acid-binding protein
MDLVVDANILFASALKDGMTAELLFIDTFRVYAPEYIFEEFAKYREMLLDRTERTCEEFERFLTILKRRIIVVPKEEYGPWNITAKDVSPDPEDVPYFALALKIGGGIWSNDRNLKSQERVPVYSTSELLVMLKDGFP